MFWAEPVRMGTDTWESTFLYVLSDLMRDGRIQLVDKHQTADVVVTCYRATDHRLVDRESRVTKTLERIRPSPRYFALIACDVSDPQIGHEAVSRLLKDQLPDEIPSAYAYRATSIADLDRHLRDFFALVFRVLDLSGPPASTGSNELYLREDDL